MTGYGEARRQDERLNVVVEVRSVNNRYLKVVTRCPEAYAALESRIERIVRQCVSRGMISVSIHVRRLDETLQYRLDRPVIEQYWKQISRLAEDLGAAAPRELGPVLQLPGVVVEAEPEESLSDIGWPLIREALEEALGRLDEFRRAEGESIEHDLRTQLEMIDGELGKVAGLAPQVVTEYRDRLRERLGELLGEGPISLDDPALLREVSLFAERCDINEEITRLRSHLKQFEVFLKQKESQGRKLEFLGQEMHREVNTIGSKANNVAIAHSVVEMKAAVEKIREILQNVE